MVVYTLADKPIGPHAREALDYIGCFTALAVSTDHHLDFWVNAQKQPDGSLIVNVLHPDGAACFVIPREEMELEIRRASAHGE